jgi:hypothetical protein
MKDNKDIARTFLSMGLQHWGQSKEDRIKAAQAVIDAARFDARVTGYPFDEGSWAGEDATEAQHWLKGVRSAMPWGKFEHEVAHIQAAIEARQLETLA